MEVFISWSGERSKLVAEYLKGWLSCVIQAVKPWMSSRDIYTGGIWSEIINDQLAKSTIGIICLTKENKDKPWILFESGALAKGISANKVCTLLIDLESNELGSPLSQFNHTLPTKESIKKLVCTINDCLVERMADTTIDNVFDIFWPKFESEFQSIISNTQNEPASVKRSTDSILEEVLYSIRNIERRVGAMELRYRKIENLEMFGNSMFANTREKANAIILTKEEYEAWVDVKGIEDSKRWKYNKFRELQDDPGEQ